ncbi:guanine nucleotide exchange factor for Rab-3A-like [Paramacrobiotus metropolitanus]|uniref:guanine nucleotide exchange factor for Rab-3A-like n=1 Tax=Paramacrobiotus metropolitanus TaxID=2943436 RepID=UPI0024464E91|nr:guanine nucleotide exchange factor for Rab-3A-like [Paramacrobiotus metropolitanus]
MDFNKMRRTSLGSLQTARLLDDFGEGDSVDSDAKRSASLAKERQKQKATARQVPVVPPVLSFPADGNRSALVEIADDDAFLSSKDGSGDGTGDFSDKNQKPILLAREQTESVLKEQLRLLQEELKLKDSECAKMQAYRDRVSAELEDLTATLFEEANKMVRDEKVRRHQAEKLYKETYMKLEALDTEMAWRREQMATIPEKTSSLPTRSASLHTLNTNSSANDALTLSGVIDWFRGAKPLANGAQSQMPSVTVDAIADENAVIRKEIDPVVHAEFVSWRQKPSLSREHPLINRIYNQDIEPNFEFTNLELAKRALKAVEQNTIFIEESCKYKPFAKVCSLSLSPRSCVYRMRLGDDNTWYAISAFARNRIISVCDFFTFIRYIQLGLVRRGVHDTWWEIVSHRERMSKARLGVL